MPDTETGIVGTQWQNESLGEFPTGIRRQHSAKLALEDRVPCLPVRMPDRPWGAGHTDVVPKPPAGPAADGGLVAMDPEGVVARKLRTAGIAPKATYTTGEVARIIGVSPETVRRLVDAYEPPAVKARNRSVRGASGLRALRIVSHRRIPHDALVDWLRENSAYLRINEDTD